MIKKIFTITAVVMAAMVIAPATGVAQTAVAAVDTLGVSGITSSQATISGEVTALNAAGGKVYFEFQGGGISGIQTLGSQTTTSQSALFTYTVTNLDPNNYYEYRLCADTAFGTGCGNFEDFQTDPAQAVIAPSVDTVSAVNITNTSATLEGQVNQLNASGGQVYFEVKTSGSLAVLTFGTQTTTQSSAKFSINASGLKSQTVYQYRFCADTTFGTGCGSYEQFTTTGTTINQPQIQTLGNAINGSSVTIEADLVDDGGSSSIEVWFDITSFTGKQGLQTLNSKGNFDHTDTYTPGVTYTYYACAENVAGVVCDTAGAQTFLIPVGTGGGGSGGGVNPGTGNSGGSGSSGGGGRRRYVRVDTNEAEQVTTTTAVMVGDITSLTNGETADVWFNIGTTASNLNTKVEAGNFDDTVKVTKLISGLQANTDYYYQACARADGRTVIDCGDTVSFTTLSFGQNTNPTGTLITQTQPAVRIENTAATIVATIEAPSSMRVFFNYQTGGQTNSTAAYTMPAGNFTVQERLFNLKKGTKYNYQVCIILTKTTVPLCSAWSTFSTTGTKYIATTQPAAIINSTKTPAISNTSTVADIPSALAYSQDLALDLDNASTTIIADEFYMYTLTLTNQGAATISDIRAVIEFDDNLKVLSVTNGLYRARLHAVTQIIESLEVGQSNQISVMVQANGDLTNTDTITNTATASFVKSQSEMRMQNSDSDTDTVPADKAVGLTASVFSGLAETPSQAAILIAGIGLVIAALLWLIVFAYRKQKAKQKLFKQTYGG